jgi:pilus assembly protein CpaB
MKAARLVLLGAAPAAGGPVAYPASGNREQEPAKEPALGQQLETSGILIAKGDLAQGQVISPRDVEWHMWPDAVLNSNFINKTDRLDAIDQFTDAIMLTPVASGEPILDLAKESGFLATVLPKRMRTVSTEITTDNAAGGFILPADQVEMLLTRRDKGAERATEKVVSEIILKNVQVLAIPEQPCSHCRASSPRSRSYCVVSPSRSLQFQKTVSTRITRATRSIRCVTAWAR